MIAVQYISLHIFLLIVLLFFCRKIELHQGDSRYWMYAFFPILCFTVVEGLRWGRETDWSLYYNVYSRFLDGEWTNHEVMFQLIWKFFAVCHAPYVVVIAFCSFLFIFSLFVFFKNYQNIIRLALPLCVCSHLIAASNLIRWYMAMSFILISLALFRKKRYIMGGCWIFFGFSVHYGTIPLIAFLFLCKKMKCIVRPLWANLICITLICVFDESMLRYISFLLEMFKKIDRFAGYFAYGMTGLFNQVSVQKSLLMSLLTYIPCAGIIIYSYRLNREKVMTKFQYNMIVLGLIIKQISVNFELFVRYYYLFDFYICLGASYVFMYLLSKKRKLTQHRIFLLFVGLYIIRKFFVSVEPYEYDQFMMYVWNENLMEPNEITAFRVMMR